MIFASVGKQPWMETASLLAHGANLPRPLDYRGHAQRSVAMAMPRCGQHPWLYQLSRVARDSYGCRDHCGRHRCTLNRPGPKLAPLMPKKERQESIQLFKTGAV
jgi:hypothetical protein